MGSLKVWLTAIFMLKLNAYFSVPTCWCSACLTMLSQHLVWQLKGKNITESLILFVQLFDSMLGILVRQRLQPASNWISILLVHKTVKKYFYICFAYRPDGARSRSRTKWCCFSRTHHITWCFTFFFFKNVNWTSLNLDKMRQSKTSLWISDYLSALLWHLLDF